MRSGYIAATLLASLLLTACQTTQVSTSNTLANQTRDQRVGVDTMQLESIDFEYAARKAVDQFLESPWYNNGKNRRWVIYMGEVINDSTSDVNTRSMTDRMRQYMTRSANFVFSAAVGSTMRRNPSTERLRFSTQYAPTEIHRAADSMTANPSRR